MDSIRSAFADFTTQERSWHSARNISLANTALCAFGLAIFYSRFQQLNFRFKLATTYTATFHATTTLIASGACELKRRHAAAAAAISSKEAKAKFDKKIKEVKANAEDPDLEALRQLPRVVFNGNLDLASCQKLIFNQKESFRLVLNQCGKLETAVVSMIAQNKHMQAVAIESEQFADQELAELLSQSHLKEIHLIGRGTFTQKSMELICEYKSLRAVTFEGCKLCGISALKAACLKKLHFIGIENLKDDSLTALEESTSIIDFSLSGCRHITDAGIRSIVKMQQLQFLDLSGLNLITDSAFENGSLPKKLRTLNLSSCIQMTNTSLLQVVKCSQLEELIVEGCRGIDNAGINTLTTLAPTLTRLNIGRTAAKAKCIESLIKMTRLQELNLNQIGSNQFIITSPALKALAFNLPELQILNLAGCEFRTQNVPLKSADGNYLLFSRQEFLDAFNSFETLNTLILGDWEKVTAEPISIFNELILTLPLSILVLQSCRSKQISTFRYLATSARFRELHLYDCREINSEHIQQLLDNKNLCALTIEGCPPSAEISKYVGNVYSLRDTYKEMQALKRPAHLEHLEITPLKTKTP